MTTVPPVLPVLRGERVVLRELADGDLPRVVEACSDLRTQYWLGQMPSPYGVDDARVWLAGNAADLAAGTRITWGIADRDDGLLLGAINLFNLRAGTEAEIGYWAHPDARGRGVMTEASRLVAGYAFDGLGLAIVRSCAAVENTASRHVIESTGMRYQGVRRLGTTIRVGPVALPADAACYDLTLEEWLALGSA